ncbi:hypothetical protein BDA99DRAFT_503650 [Phascolomyces articulosus]|uniref:Snurportin-1 n=1 Tax=Phascolomyces articulosus TaxID=60185 RepID=A0AAD5PG81_9FUNG|nr:hypothetical protein BDA99DRAFT_503650 [Phascolomyces articulosus]
MSNVPLSKEAKEPKLNNFVFQHPVQHWKPDFENNPSTENKLTNTTTTPTTTTTTTTTTSPDRSNVEKNQQNKSFTFSKNNVHVDWDDLSSQFEQNVSMSSTNSRQTRRQESFLAFKAPLTHKASQEERRRRALEMQKTNRLNNLNTRRRNYAKTQDEDEDEDASNDDDESSSSDDDLNSATSSMDNYESEEQPRSMKRGRDENNDGRTDWMVDDAKIQRVDIKSEKNKKSKRKKNKRKFKKQQGNAVMYGESLDEIPHDFYTNWVMMPYPTGKRCILTTGRGETIARRKNGSIWKRFQSMLPNGSKGKHDWKNTNQCILDCIYDPVHWTFYILDVMCWKGYSIYDCDTDFRHFWLQSKVESEMDTRTNENMFYKFKILRPIPMSEFNHVCDGAQKYMKNQGYDFKLDGILFYHRETRYIEGSTPLVVWVPGDDNLNQFK